MVILFSILFQNWNNIYFFPFIWKSIKISRSYEILEKLVLNYTDYFFITSYTAKNTIISPDLLMWRFCGKAGFPHSFGRITRNYAKTVPFHKISTPGNQVRLQYFSQFMMSMSISWNLKLGLTLIMFYK